MLCCWIGLFVAPFGVSERDKGGKFEGQIDVNLEVFVGRVKHFCWRYLEEGVTRRLGRNLPCDKQFNC